MPEYDPLKPNKGNMKCPKSLPSLQDTHFLRLLSPFKEFSRSPEELHAIALGQGDPRLVPLHGMVSRDSGLWGCTGTRDYPTSLKSLEWPQTSHKVPLGAHRNIFRAFSWASATAIDQNKLCPIQDGNPPKESKCAS